MTLENRILDIVDKESASILELSHNIHEHPELGNQEFYACDAQCKFLEAHGFTVTKGVAGLATAYTAVKTGKQPGPKIAILAEYDALKDIGHACGHNIIASCACGSAIAAAAALEEFPGTIMVAGTPAEETMGGKINMVDAGIFDDVDFVMEVHPTAGPSTIMRGGRACTTVYADFTGVSAHSSKPSSGVNAVSCVVATFQNIDALRPLFEPMDNVNGVIPYGGGANNVISGEARCEFCLRSDTLFNLKNLVKRVEHAANCVAMLFGAKVETRVDPLFAERYPNAPMGMAFKKHLESLGEPVEIANPVGQYGSSDIGNVSLKVPSIHEYISIAPEGVNGHSAEMREAAISPDGDRGCILASKALALTALELLSNEELRKEAKASFEKQVPAIYR